MTQRTPDVTIIGAGIAGASLAGQLAPYCSVRVLEMEAQPGYHATGRSAAYYAPAYGSDVVRQVTRASDSFFRSPPDGFTDVPLINARAALFVGRQSQMDALRAMAGLPDCELLDADAVTHLVPVIREDIIAGGVLDVTGGDLDVDAILQGFLRSLRQHGGEVVTTARVQDMERVAGNWRVRTSAGVFESPVVVNAAGAWADQLASLAGVEPIGLTPKRRTAVLVDAPQGVDISRWPLTVDVDEQFYFKPDAGQLLISPADETPSEPMDAQPGELDMALGVDRVQGVADIPVRRINHQWAGLRTFAPDNSFVSGFDPAVEGFYWLAGQGGYGVQSCPAMAEVATFNISGETNWLNRETASVLAELIAPGRQRG